jgi:pyruvate,orthophosphate dikinase
MTKFVYDFSQGGMDQKDLLGGKGANLAEMTKLGLSVPQGFTIAPTRVGRTWMGERRRRGWTTR